MSKSIFDKGLPKWPALVVKGEKVTPQQAMEIIIRTDSFSFSGNDREFEQSLNQIIFGIEGNSWNLTDEIEKKFGFSFAKAWEWKEEQKKQYGVLELAYLNNSRIISCWVGGPHGWCDWEGNIFANTYNIGKWPSIEEVYQEWCTIASAFPFLTLTSQLLNGEAGISSEPQDPVVEFHIEKGRVIIYEPTAPLVETTNVDFAVLINPYGERGCTLSQFDIAQKYVKDLMAKRK